MKRCLICGKKIDLTTGKCTDKKCSFKTNSKDLQKSEETYNKEEIEKST